MLFVPPVKLIVHTILILSLTEFTAPIYSSYGLSIDGKTCLNLVDCSNDIIKELQNATAVEVKGQGNIYPKTIWDALGSDKTPISIASFFSLFVLVLWVVACILCCTSKYYTNTKYECLIVVNIMLWIILEILLLCIDAILIYEIFTVEQVLLYTDIWITTLLSFGILFQFGEVVWYFVNKSEKIDYINLRD